MTTQLVSQSHLSHQTRHVKTRSCSSVMELLRANTDLAPPGIEYVSGSTRTLTIAYSMGKILKIFQFKWPPSHLQHLRKWSELSRWDCIIRALKACLQLKMLSYKLDRSIRWVILLKPFHSRHHSYSEPLLAPVVTSWQSSSSWAIRLIVRQCQYHMTVFRTSSRFSRVTYPSQVRDKS